MSLVQRTFVHRTLVHRTARTTILRGLPAAVLLSLHLLIPCASPGQATQRTHTSSSKARSLSASDQVAFAAALKAQDSGDRREAESTLRDLARRNPNSFEVAETLGLLYAESGEFTPAIPFLEKACSLNSSSAIALANLGAAYLKVNREKDAVPVLTRSVALDPGNAQTLSSLGTALLQTGRSQQAAAAFAKAASRNPSDPDLLYNWALALFNSGQTTTANEVLSRVSDKDSSSQAQSLLGDIEERQGHYEQAVAHLQAAAKLDPSEANMYALGIEFLRHWTFDPAIRIFQFGLERYPSSTRLLLGLGVARYSMNDVGLAAPIFSRLLVSDPDNALYAELLGHSCSLMPETSKGCDKLESFAERHPKNAMVATYAAANILHRPSTPENASAARKLLETAIADDPHSPEAYYQMGLLEQYQSRWPESIVPLEKAIALKPAFSKAHYRLALAYSHAGEREKAHQEIALQKQYSQQEKDDLNAKFKEVTTFLVTMH